MSSIYDPLTITQRAPAGFSTPDFSSYNDWSVDNANDPDELNNRAGYADYVRKQYIANGNFDDPRNAVKLEESIRQNTRDAALAEVEGAADRIDSMFAPKEQPLDTKLAFIKQYSDSNSQEWKSADTYLAHQTSLMQSGAEGNENPLTEERTMQYQQEAEELAGGAAYQKALRTAVDRGDMAMARLTDENGESYIHSGKLLDTVSFKDAMQQSVAMGGMSYSDAASARSLYSVDENYNEPYHKVRRWQEQSNVLEKLSLKNKDLGKSMQGLQALYAEKEDGGEPSPEFQAKEEAAIAQVYESLISTGAYDKDTAPDLEDVSRAASNMAQMNNFYNSDAEDAESEEVGKNIQRIGYNNLVMHPAAMLNKKMFDASIKANQDLTPSEINMLTRRREFEKEQNFADYNERLANDSVVGDKWITALQIGRTNGQKDADTLDLFINDEDNYSSAKGWLSGIWSSVEEGVSDLAAAVGVMTGNTEWALPILQQNARDKASRREMSALFGKEYGFGRNAIEMLAPMLTDMAATALLSIPTAGAGGAGYLIAKQGATLTAKGIAKGLVTNTFRRQVGEGAEAAAQRLVTEKLIRGSSETVKLKGAKEVLDSFNNLTARRWGIDGAVFVPSATRAGGMTYGSVYTQLQQDNPDATHEENHDKAMGAAIMSGLMTGLTTVVFGRLGFGGVEDALVRGATYGQLKRVLEPFVKKTGTTFDKAVTGAYKDALKQTGMFGLRTGLAKAGLKGTTGDVLAEGIKGAVSEAPEEALQEFLDGLISDAATDSETPFAERISQSFNAALYGAVLGGAITSGKSLVTAGNQLKIDQQVAPQMLNSFEAKVAAKLEESGSPLMAEQVRNVLRSTADTQVAAFERARQEYESDQEQAPFMDDMPVDQPAEPQPSPERQAVRAELEQAELEFEALAEANPVEEGAEPNPEVVAQEQKVNELKQQEFDLAAQDQADAAQQQATTDEEVEVDEEPLEEQSEAEQETEQRLRWAEANLDVGNATEVLNVTASRMQDLPLADTAAIYDLLSEYSSEFDGDDAETLGAIRSYLDQNTPAPEVDTTTPQQPEGAIIDFAEARKKLSQDKTFDQLDELMTFMEVLEEDGYLMAEEFDSIAEVAMNSSPREAAVMLEDLLKQKDKTVNFPSSSTQDSESRIKLTPQQQPVVTASTPVSEVPVLKQEVDYNTDVARLPEFAPPSDPSLQNSRNVEDPSVSKSVGERGKLVSGASKEGDIIDPRKRTEQFESVGYETQQDISDYSMDDQAKLASTYGMSTLSKIRSAKVFNRNGAHFMGGVTVDPDLDSGQAARVIAHELGHAAHSLLGDAINKDPAIQSELQAIEETLYPNLRETVAGAKNVDNQFFNYLLSSNELIAEFNALRIKNPDLANQIAPTLTSKLQSVDQDPDLVVDRSTVPTITGKIEKTGERLTFNERDGLTFRQSIPETQPTNFGVRQMKQIKRFMDGDAITGDFKTALFMVNAFVEDGGLTPERARAVLNMFEQRESSGKIDLSNLDTFSQTKLDNIRDFASAKPEENVAQPVEQEVEQQQFTNADFERVMGEVAPDDDAELEGDGPFGIPQTELDPTLDAEVDPFAQEELDFSDMTLSPEQDEQLTLFQEDRNKIEDQTIKAQADTDALFNDRTLDSGVNQVENDWESDLSRDEILSTVVEKAIPYIRDRTPAEIDIVIDETISAPMSMEGTTMTINPWKIGNEIAKMGGDGSNTGRMLDSIMSEENAHFGGFMAFDSAKVDEMAAAVGVDELSSVAQQYYNENPAMAEESIKKLRSEDPAVAKKEAATMVEEQLRMKLQRATRGFTTEEDVLFLRTNPSMLAMTTRYFEGGINRIAANFDLKTNPNSVVNGQVNNMVAQLRSIKARHHVGNAVMTFNPNNPNQGLDTMLGMQAETANIEEQLGMRDLATSVGSADSLVGPLTEGGVDIQGLQPQASQAQNTQRANTQTAYKGVGNILGDVQRGKVVDYGAGLGTNTQYIQGDETIQHEPYPKGWTPDTTTTEELLGLHEGTADTVVSNLVYNVIRDPNERLEFWRNIGKLMKVGGQAFVATRSPSQVQGKTSKADLDGWLMNAGKSNQTWQRGYTTNDLIGYAQQSLGDGYTITQGKFAPSGNGQIIITKTSQERSASTSTGKGKAKSEFSSRSFDFDFQNKIFEVPMLETGGYNPPTNIFAKYVLGDPDVRLTRLHRVYKALERQGGTTVKQFDHTFKKLLTETYGDDHKQYPHEDIATAIGSNAGVNVPQEILNDLEEQLDQNLQAVDDDPTTEYKDKKLAKQVENQLHQNRVEEAMNAEAQKMRAEQRSAMERIQKDSPDLARHMHAMRTDLIDTLSGLLKDDYNLGGALGIKVDANMGIYITRSYKMFSEIGYRDKLRQSLITNKKAVDAFLGEVDTSNMTDEEVETMLAESKENYDEVQQEGIEFFEQATLDNISTDPARIKAFMDEGMSEADAQAEAYVTARDIMLTPAYRDASYNAMLQFVDEYANPDAQNIVASTAGYKVLMDNLRQKKDIPEQLRKVLGENTDQEQGVNNLLRTYATVFSMVNRQSFLRNIVTVGTAAQSPNPKLADKFLLTPAEYQAAKEEDPEKYDLWRPVRGDAKVSEFDPLGNLWGPPDMIDHLNAMTKPYNQDQNMTSNEKLGDSMTKFLHQLTGLSMATKTLGSVSWAQRNMIGNLTVFPMMNGWFRPDKIMKQAKLVWRKRNADEAYAVDAEIQELVGLDILDSNMRMTIMKDLLRGTGDVASLQEEINELTSQEEKLESAGMTGKAWDKTKKIGTRVAELGDSIDGFYKMAYFYNELEVLKAAKEKAPEGTPLAAMSDYQLKQEAANKVNRTSQSASYRVAIAQKLSSSPLGLLIAPFIGFTADMFRVPVGIFKVANEEMQSGNSVLRKRGLKRMTGLTGTLATTAALPTVFAQLFGGLDDEDRTTLGEALPPFLKGHSIYYFKMGDELKQIDLTYTNPVAMIVDPSLRGYENLVKGEYSKAMVAMLKGYVGDTFLNEQILAGTVGSWWRNKDELTGKPIYDERLDSFGEIARKTFKHIYEKAYEPDTFKRLVLAGQRLGGDTEGIPANETALGVLASGLKPAKWRDVDLQKEFTRLVYAEKEAKSAVRDNLNGVFRKKPMSEDTIADFYRDYYEDEHKLNTRMHKFVKSFMNMGVDEGYLRNALVKSGYGKRRVQALFDGYTERPSLTPQMMKNLEDRELINRAGTLYNTYVQSPEFRQIE